MSGDGAEIGLEYLPESKVARSYLLGLGKGKLGEFSAQLATSLGDSAEVSHDRTRVRLRGIIETLLNGGSVTEIDMMALAWWAKTEAK